MSIVWHHQKDVRFTLRKETSSSKWSPKKLVLNRSFCCFIFPLEYGSKKITALPNWSTVKPRGTLHLSEVSGTEICYRLEADWRRSTRDAWMLIDWKVRFLGRYGGRKVVKDSLPWMGFFGDSLHQVGIPGRFFRLERKKTNPPQLTTGRSSEPNPFIIVFQNVKAFKGCKLSLLGKPLYILTSLSSTRSPVRGSLVMGSLGPWGSGCRALGGLASRNFQQKS